MIPLLSTYRSGDYSWGEIAKNLCWDIALSLGLPVVKPVAFLGFSVNAVTGKKSELRVADMTGFAFF